MKYKEMAKFLNDNNICMMQPVIASEVANQLDYDIDDDRFEEVCEEIYKQYLAASKEPSIWWLVHVELTKRKYKRN